MLFLSPSQTLIMMMMDGDSMSLLVARKAAKRKYGVTWTRKTSIQPAIYEGMQRIAGEQKLLQPLTKQRRPPMLVRR
jgi:hypothetical protein